ncbi:hypothetical protein [Candidatus Deferrimicrobium sp.]|uniref:hypothetical protein n=1 Tax=Candidatus Deferrimicrobium sp. TaxID=3060586 RepID=UPI002ED28413
MTTSSGTLGLRFTKIDDLKRPDHFYLTAEDECFFLREYTARAGFGHSETNDLIQNFKKSPDRKGLPEWYYKERDLRRIALEFRQAMGEKWISLWTLVPIPPSKCRTDPMYDDRLLRMLLEMTIGIRSDIRELIHQTKSVAAAHESDDRPSPDEIERFYKVDEGVAEPTPKSIALVDDVLTTGSHFKAAKRVLSDRFPKARIIGVFIARRVPEPLF